MKERLEKIKHSIGIIVDEVAELEKDLNKEIAVVEEKEWKPKYEEEYYYIDLDCMTIDFAIWYNDSCDIAHLKHKVIFKTEQEAEEYFDYLQVKEKAMNEFSQEEWKNGEIDKYEKQIKRDMGICEEN